MLKTISASALKTYETCPLQFKYNYILKLAQLPNDAFKIGTALHKCLELYHQGRDPQDFLKDIYESIAPNKTKEELEMYSTIRNMLEAYIRNPINENNVETEFKFTYGIKDIPIPLFGFIDRITEDGIVEYKTSSMDYKLEDADTIQATTYSYAYWRKFGTIPRVRFVVFNKKKAKKKDYKPQIIDIKRTEVDMALFEDHCRDFYQKVENKEFKHTPGIHCRWCPFGTNGTNNCKYASK